LPDHEEETYSVMFSSLKHPIRRKILRILVANPQTFTEILEQVNIESAHLSYHLENLGDLTKKTNEGKYSLSDLGQAAVSLMTKVEEPEKLVTPTILRTPRRLNVLRVFSLAAILIGVLLLVNGLMALPSVDYRMTRMGYWMDTDYWVSQPYNLSLFGAYYYQGDGLYGVEIDLVFRDAFSEFPLNVRLSTTTDWNQSWYEWTQLNPPNVPGMRERLSVTLLISGNSVQIVSQDSFDHVHPSPGKVIGEFRREAPVFLLKWHLMWETETSHYQVSEPFRLNGSIFPNLKAVERARLCFQVWV
jgi:DNA-binding transcriptional ArsR family regulator